MSRYVDIETISPRQYENSEVELGVLAYDYDEVNAMSFLDIVWCKECKYWHKNRKDGDDIPVYDACYDFTADDFCSYGVRKTNTTAEEKPTPIRDYMVHGEREGE